MIFVSDTHALVWYFTDDDRLGRDALHSFESTVRKGLVIVPTVVLAEVLYIAQKGRIELGFQETVARIEALENFTIAPLDLTVLHIADSIEIELEMHDKLIVATARCYDAVLLSRDERIKNSNIVKTLW